ncbi:MAG TPA: glutamate--cysteine ligase [Gammaproteobacteria bacterium]|nr:glutamate--cysteine ligase [Gammaproteobacteria bacterium]
MATHSNITGADDGAFAARLRWLETPGNAHLVRGGLRGVEKESLRVRPDGRLSHLPHPRAWGAALTHPYLTTDYSESLPEFVTPPQHSNWETLQFLCDLHAFAYRRLDGELLWPASMPCVLHGNDEIPIADYGRSNPGLIKTVYRRGLGFRYGRSMQAIAGVHFNYSLPSEFWPAHREREGSSLPARDFRSERFMGLVRNYRRCAWLVTYLFGASPALSKSFRPEGHELLTELDPDTWYSPFATSLRMSDLGYRNKTQGRLSISANSIAEYVGGLVAAMTTVEPRYAAIGVVVDGEYRQLNANLLQIENEYYSSIRPKPSKASSSRPAAALRSHGVEYVEVRTLDLSPRDPVGINQNQLRFIEALLLYCLLADSPPIGAAEQAEIDSRDLTVARDGRRPGRSIVIAGAERPVADSGLEIVARLDRIAALLDSSGEGYVAAVGLARDALRDPERTPSAALLRDLAAERATFSEHALALARAHAEYFMKLAVAPAREQALDDIAARSLAEAAALEKGETRPFDEYLREFLYAV